MKSPNTTESTDSRGGRLTREVGAQVKAVMATASPRVTQAQLATACGLSRATVSAILNGHQVASLAHLEKFAAVLNIHPARLFVGIDPAPSDPMSGHRAA